MNFQSTCKISVIPTSKPYERTWETTDKVTGQPRQGSVHVMKGVIIPQNPDADPCTLKEVEMNINTSKTGIAKKNISDMVEIYFENKRDFEDGKAYLEIETYMGPRTNRDGIVTFFSPWINNAQVLKPSEEDVPHIKAALRRGEGF